MDNKIKIIVCTLAINDWYRNIIKYSLKNLNYYCDLYNYKYICQTEETENTVYDNTRAPCWYKIKLIKNIMKENNCDYIVWIDADCQILKHDIKLEYFIEKYFINNDINLVITQDNNIFNTGVMFLKNTEFNINLMDKIWDGSPDLYHNDFHEQTSFANIYKSEPDIQKHINIIPYGLKDELVVYWAGYFPGKNFLLHCARCAHDIVGFMYMMDKYYPFKIDEETDDEYKYRMEWFNNQDICRSDINKWLRGEHVDRRYSARCKKEFKFLN